MHRDGVDRRADDPRRRCPARGGREPCPRRHGGGRSRIGGLGAQRRRCGRLDAGAARGLGGRVRGPAGLPRPLSPAGRQPEPRARGHPRAAAAALPAAAVTHAPARARLRHATRRGGRTPARGGRGGGPDGEGDPGMTDLQDLLAKTSRTFALAIPLLPEPTCREVSVAYLLFRIADTFEDATAWDAAAKRRSLVELAEVLGALGEGAGWRDRTAALAERWRTTPPVEHAGYRELLAATTGVFEALEALRPAARQIVVVHVARSAAGMAAAAGDGLRGVDRGLASAGVDGVELGSLEDLRHYCYIVAGIVGEMLTELFLLDWPQLAPVAPSLRARAVRFGEALQLVNVLKDADTDRAEGRCFLPAAVPRQRVFELARADVATAGEYVLTLQRGGAPRGVVAFTALPRELARASLDYIERQGPGAKIGRAAVLGIVARLERALDAGQPAVPDLAAERLRGRSGASAPIEQSRAR